MKPSLPLKKGERFLVKDTPSSEIFNAYELYLPLKNGAFEFEVDGDQAKDILEFNCDIENAKAYMGAFADVTIYKDELTQEPSCQISTGTVISENGGGFSYVDDLGDFSVYELYGELPEEICPEGGMFVRSVDVEYKDQIQVFMPLNFFMAVDE